MFSLAGHTAIVTGEASGIGLATAEMLAGMGARIVIADLNDDAGIEVAERLAAKDAETLFFRTDVAEPGDAAALIEAATGRFGSLEILMHDSLKVSTEATPQHAPARRPVPLVAYKPRKLATRVTMRP